MSAALHRVPGKLDFRGETDVAHFTGSIEHPTASNADQAMIVRFRGRRLIGRTVTLPPGMTGAILLCGVGAVDAPDPGSPSDASRAKPTTPISAAREGKRGRDLDISLSPSGVDFGGSPLGRGSHRVEGGGEAVAAAGGSVDVLSRFTKFVTWEHDREPLPAAVAALENWAELAPIVMAGAYE